MSQYSDLLIPTQLIQTEKSEYSPGKNLLFRAFNINIEDIKVIIVGQDPYPIEGIATGLAFAVNKDSDIPSSLRVIIDELALTYYHDITFDENNIDRTLEHWEEQGVLLLNASLSCDFFKPEGLDDLHKNGTHSNYWRFILMEELFKEMNTILNDCVFVFMGQKAQYYNKYIDVTKNHIINTIHPVVDYRLNKQLFVGCQVFNKINDYLTTKNKAVIEWQN